MIRRLIVAGMIVLPLPAAAEPWRPWAAHIAEASARFRVPPAWIQRVMLVESGGRATSRGRAVRSRAGAMGLMQLMPRTWRGIRARHGLGLDPDDPRDNILAGTAYLRDMYDRFGYPGLFAAYNAGPARYADHRAHGTRLPLETIDYVARVTGGGSRMIGGSRANDKNFALWDAPGVKPIPRVRNQDSEANALRSSVFFALGAVHPARHIASSSSSSGDWGSAGSLFPD